MLLSCSLSSGGGVSLLGLGGGQVIFKGEGVRFGVATPCWEVLSASLVGDDRGDVWSSASSDMIVSQTLSLRPKFIQIHHGLSLKY